jgi:hypothetical protein
LENNNTTKDNYEFSKYSFNNPLIENQNTNESTKQNLQNKVVEQKKLDKQKVQVLYYLKEGVNSDYFCSGLKQGQKVLTASHCIYGNSDFKSNQDRVAVDDRVFSKNVVIRKDLEIVPNTKSEFMIGTADKGLVGAVKYADGCLDSDCYYFQVRSYRVLGQGNSGSPLWDPEGDYVGSLSYGILKDEQSCEKIVFNHPTITNIEDGLNRICSYILVFNTDFDYRLKIGKVI